MVDDTFIIDYDTLDTILYNSTRICKKNKLCKKCEKEIVNHYAESCKVFEYTILLNRQKNKNVKKTPYGCTYYFYDEVDIINDFLVNSALDFVQTALTNIFLNTKECHNGYFYVYPRLVDGNKLDILEDGKRYIKFYVDLQPIAECLMKKNDKNKFIYLKRN
tara:strand:- start:97 stop:582 length:486 start_codon:yes stop_codon:yes gene_type:complete